jgi:hypothetical protein
MTDPSAAIGPIILWVVLGLIVYVWTALSLQAVFRKAGEDGWKAWVPFLNTATVLQLGRISGWWVLLVIFPPAAIVVWILQIVACHRINVAFELGAGMTVLAALLFPVWSSIVGWGSATWVGADGATQGGPLRTPPTELDARFGAPFAAREVAPEPIVAAVPARAVAGPDPVGAAAVDHRPADAAPAAAPSTATAPSTEEFPPPPPLPASAGEAEPAASVPGPPPPAAAAAASTRSQVRGFPGPVTSAPADYPGPLRGRAGAAAGYDEDDDVDVVDDPIDRIAPAPARSPLPPVEDSELPPGPRRSADPFADPPAPADPARPAPIQSVPPPEPTVPIRDPWAPPAVPYGATRTPRRSPDPTSTDGFAEISAEVSAVAGAPRLGEPMSALASVSARRVASELPNEDAVPDETVVAARRRDVWMLTPPLGAAVTVSRDVLIIGRRPSPDPAFPGAQLVSVADETRTMSKTHARLELDDGEWTIVDLDSTNGVVLLSADGRETELLPGRAHIATERFLLGDAELRLAHGA